MFCTVVVVWPAGSNVSGSMPTAIENDESASPPELAAGSCSKLHAPSRSPAATSATKGFIRAVRPRTADLIMDSCLDEWTFRVVVPPGSLRDHRAYFGEMACAGMAVAEAVRELRLLLGADLLGDGAAGSEVAARRWVRRARCVAGEDDSLPSPPLAWIGDGHCRQEGLVVGVRGMVVDVRPRPDLDDLAE